jgi:Xaa-Pro aminopeptidase
MKKLFFVIYLLSLTFAQSQNGKLSPKFYKDKREVFREKMPENSVAVLFSAPIRNRANDVDYVFHQDPNFFYLTGWHQPHSVLMIYKNPQVDELGSFNEKIYILERDKYKELWNGKRYSVEAVKKLGFERVNTRNHFMNDISNLSTYDKVLMFGFNNDIRNQEDDPFDLFDLKAAFKKAINFPSSFDRELYTVYQHILKADDDSIESIREEVKAHVQLDSTLVEDEIIKQFLLYSNNDFFTEVKTKTAFALRNFNFDLVTLPQIMKDMREIKSDDEIELIKKAVAISVIGQKEVMKAMHADMTEREIQGIHEFVYRKYGAADEGYPSIVGAGENSCVLHYIENEKKELDNQLVLMDLGAEFYGFTADVTRTIPANGIYSQAQRELYEIVYEAQEKAIQASQVGISFDSLYKLSYEIVSSGLIRLGIIDDISDARSYYPHGLSHHIGLDVHDPGNYVDLAADMVITIEPGIYIPAGSPCDPKWWNIGIRIEDDILITENGPVNLSEGAPRKWQEVELLMKQESVLDAFILPKIETLIK